LPAGLLGECMSPAETLAPRLATQLESLKLVLNGVTEMAVRARPKSGKWSAHENLAHLVQHHRATLGRIRRILAEDRPELPSYRAENDPEWPGQAAAGTEEVRLKLLAARQEMITLTAGLSPQQWLRIGIHPTFGPMTLAEWLDFFLIHEAHHLYVAATRAHRGE
jgi:DinB superfamily